MECHLENHECTSPDGDGNCASRRRPILRPAGHVLIGGAAGGRVGDLRHCLPPDTIALGSFMYLR
jgi:hypothetical protein